MFIWNVMLHALKITQSPFPSPFNQDTGCYSGGTMALQGAWLTRRRIWNLSTLSCPLCSVHLLLSSSTVSWVFVFVHSYLYLSIRVCICEFVFVSHALWYLSSPLQYFLWNFSCPRAVDTSGCGVGSRCVAAPPWEFPTIEREIAPPRTICPTTCGRFAHCDLFCGRSYLPTLLLQFRPTHKVLTKAL